MTRLSLPPRYVNVPVNDAFDRDLPDPVFRTMVQIHGLAWQTRGERTPPMSVADLATCRGMQERQTYNHLKMLKAQGFIRVENLGHNKIVIFPLRWEQGAALPADDDSMLTADDLDALCDAPDPYSTPAKNCSNPVDKSTVTAENCSDFAENQDFTAENCSDFAENQDFTAKNCSDFDHEHVVVNHDLNMFKKQQHEHGPSAAKNCSNLIEPIADIFTADGAAPAEARRTARRLLDRYGEERCHRQLAHFPRRCERAKSGRQGLHNPSGLFVRSVEQNWSPPAPPKKKKTHETWYTQEEFEQFIQH